MLVFRSEAEAKTGKSPRSIARCKWLARCGASDWHNLAERSVLKEGRYITNPNKAASVGQISQNYHKFGSVQQFVIPRQNGQFLNDPSKISDILSQILVAEIRI